MAEPNDWKKRLGIVYSTNPEFDYSETENSSAEPVSPATQKLYVSLDRKQRKGKVVTLVTGFIGSDAALAELGRELKKKCGTGGSVKEGQIIIQGDFKVQVGEYLSKAGYAYKYK